MHAEVSNGNGHVVIRLEGRFTFDAHAAFLDAGERAIGLDTREIRVNFSKVEYMDSTGLGLLLILRDKASSAGKSVSLAGCGDAVGKVIELANFHKLFGIAGVTPS